MMTRIFEDKDVIRVRSQLMPDRVTAAEAIVRTLIANNVDTFFSVPGVHLYDLYDALARCDAAKIITARHEQGCGLHGIWLRAFNR